MLEVRSLGLVKDEELMFVKYTADIDRNNFYRPSLLYKIRKYISTDLRTKLCNSLFLSKYNYLSVVYGLRMSTKTSDLVQRVQNACARYCFNSHRRANVTQCLNTGNMLKLRWRSSLYYCNIVVLTG